MLRLDTEGDILSIIYDDDWDGEAEVFIKEEDARKLMNDLYDYFENKDREAWAKILTRRKESGTL